jgi:hypothetical protein
MLRDYALRRPARRLCPRGGSALRALGHIWYSASRMHLLVDADHHSVNVFSVKKIWPISAPRAETGTPVIRTGQVLDSLGIVC